MPDNSKFFEKDKLCPVCNNPLTLYLSILDRGVFKYQFHLSSKKKNKFIFYPLKDSSFALTSGINKTDYIKVNTVNDKDFNMTFSSESLFRTIEYSFIHLFYICNLESFAFDQYAGSITNYKIDPFEACYFKSSNQLKFVLEDEKYSLICDKDNAVNCEIFGFTNQADDCLKKYCLYYDYNAEKTKFYFEKHQLVHESTVDNKSFFSKELELLSYYPNFSNKEKIIDKFESWILLS